MNSAVRLSRWILGLILLWAALSKISDMNAFYVSLARSGLIPTSLAMPIALAVPSLELTLAIFLLVGAAPQPAAIGAAALFLFFLAWQIASVMRGETGAAPVSD